MHCIIFSLPKNLYTLSLECIYDSAQRKSLVGSKTSLLENRQVCNSTECEFGEFCIESTHVNGYKCHGSKCAEGYVNCSARNRTDGVMCIQETRACDGITDCLEAVG